MKRIIAVLSFASIALSAFSQGCSDSGFCTMGALKPDQPYMRKLSIRINSIELTQHLGHTRQGDWIHATFADVNVGLTRKTNVQLRLPAYTIIEGNMPRTTGWGDFFFNVSQNVLATDQFQLTATAGAKIATGRGNKASDEGHAMPLYQQTTSGSDDVSVGAALLSRRWLVAAGYQKVLSRSGNQFHADAWSESPYHNVMQQYDASAGLWRGDDVMLRLERNFRLSQWNVYTGILNVWRVSEDKMLMADGSGSAVRGSAGLASSFIAGAGYRFNVHSGLRLVTAWRLKEREANPDGLARDFVAQLAYIFRF
jgi:hypothetical protein